MIDTTHAVTWSVTAPLRLGETLTTPRGHKLSLAYDSEGHVYNLTIERERASRVEGWATMAQACARAEAMMGVAS